MNHSHQNKRRTIAWQKAAIRSIVLAHQTLASRQVVSDRIEDLKSKTGSHKKVGLIISLDQKLEILVLEDNIKDLNKIEIVDTINATYFPINKNIEYNNLNINLLMSDVF